MAGEIKGLEIFGAGTWNASTGKVTITEQDIQDIVDNFEALKDTNIVKPHLKLGHQDAQKWFGQTTGIPTLGWIDRVWREGKKVLADISGIPNALIDLMKQGRYHNVSAEVYPPGVIEHNGKKLGSVLSAVAILGTEMPAVKDLAGLANALFAQQFTSEVKESPTHYTKETAFMFTPEQHQAILEAAVAKAVKDALDQQKDQFASLQTEIGVLKQRAESAEAKLADSAKQFAQKEIETIIEDAIKNGKIVPAQKDMVKQFAANLLDRPMKFGDKEMSAADALKSFIGSFKGGVDFSERGSGSNGSAGGGTGFATAAEEVDARTRKLMSEDTSGKLLYGDAFRRVLDSDAALKQRYAEGSN